MTGFYIRALALRILPSQGTKSTSRAEAMVIRSGTLTGRGDEEDTCTARAWSLQEREEIKERDPLPSAVIKL